MTTIRLFPPATDISKQTLTFAADESRGVVGRTYTGAPGETLDVPDFDAQGLNANGWTWVAPVGATSERPEHPAASDRFVDTTLGKIVVFDGETWRDPLTGDAA